MSTQEAGLDTKTDQTLTAKPSFRRILSNKAFTLLWIGQVVSQSGDYIFDVVALWLVLQLPDPVFKAGLTTAVVLLPGVIVGPIAGVYVDRFNRRDIIIGANIFQAVVVGLIAVLYGLESLSFPLLLGLIFLLNTGAQFVRPAVGAAIPQLADKSDLAAANGLFSISSSINQVAGYGIGGLVVLFLGIAVPIYYDGITFVIAALTCGMITRSILQVKTPEPQTNTPAKSSFTSNLREGLQFIRTSRVLLELVVLAAVLNFFGGGIQTLIGPYSKITLNGNSATYGALLVGLSIGTLLGSVVVGKINARAYVGKLLFVGVLTIGISVAGLGVFRVFPVAVSLMLAIGLALALANLPIQVLIQVKVPSHLMGRVLTSLVAVVTLTQPIAAVATGSIAGLLSTGLTLIIYGVLMTMISSAGYFAFKEIREAKY